jgi:hypothetical protein
MATQPISPRRDHRRKQLLRRFDRTVGQINPFLFAIAIGFRCLVYHLSLRADGETAEHIPARLRRNFGDAGL